MIEQELPIAERLTGPAIVTDGDTIRIGTRTIRLQAIDAPEMSQTCRNSAGTDYLCGRDAKDHLASLIGDFAVTCESMARDPQDRYGRMLGFCRRAPDGPSLNLAMVRAGQAVAYRRYIEGRPHEAAFISAENEARDAARGMWAGTFTLPWEWRAARRGG